MHRRQFIARSGMALGSLAGLAHAEPPQPPLSEESLAAKTPTRLDDWDAVRAEFDLDPACIHMSGFFLASHPRCVRQAIERHRAALDFNPIVCKQNNTWKNEVTVLKAAAGYLGAQPPDIALTDSTTMGLSILYGTIKLNPGHEILTTTHDHYATWRNLELRAERTGAHVRAIPLYARSADANEAAVVAALTAAITDVTRVVAVTWVHSGTGVKLPIRAMAEALSSVNARRADADRIIFCVDGVHGLGVEDVTLPDLGCDFFVAGTHKWIMGPRGTGVLWGRPQSQNLVAPLIPAFTPNHYNVEHEEEEPFWGMSMTPGGFHSFEHRWALNEAFEFLQRIGKDRVERRIHDLNSQLKQGMAGMKHITLHTPISPEMSAGIVCFEVEGLSPSQVVQRLAAKRIIASASPYAVQYARLAPSLLVTAQQVETVLRELERLA